MLWNILSKFFLTLDMSNYFITLKILYSFVNFTEYRYITGNNNVTDYDVGDTYLMIY